MGVPLPGDGSAEPCNNACDFFRSGPEGSEFFVDQVPGIEGLVELGPHFCAGSLRDGQKLVKFPPTSPLEALREI